MSEDNTEQYVEDIPHELQDMIFAGKKIEAIKYAREKMGWGLKESKERVEQLQSVLYEKFPDRFSSDPSQASGCGAKAAVILIAAIALSASALAFCGVVLF